MLVLISFAVCHFDIEIASFAEARLSWANGKTPLTNSQDSNRLDHHQRAFVLNDSDVGLVACVDTVCTDMWCCACYWLGLCHRLVPLQG